MQNGLQTTFFFYLLSHGCDSRGYYYYSKASRLKASFVALVTKAARSGLCKDTVEFIIVVEPLPLYYASNLMYVHYCSIYYYYLRLRERSPSRRSFSFCCGETAAAPATAGRRIIAQKKKKKMRRET